MSRARGNIQGQRQLITLEKEKDKIKALQGKGYQRIPLTLWEGVLRIRISSRGACVSYPSGISGKEGGSSRRTANVGPAFAVRNQFATKGIIRGEAFYIIDHLRKKKNTHGRPMLNEV